MAAVRNINNLIAFQFHPVRLKPTLYYPGQPGRIHFNSTRSD